MAADWPCGCNTSDTKPASSTHEGVSRAVCVINTYLDCNISQQFTSASSHTNMRYSKLSNKSVTGTMKHLLLMAFAILTIGCGEKDSDGVNVDELEAREGVTYLKNSDSPYTGKVFEFHYNGQKKSEGNYKDGKPDGLTVSWHENGQNRTEINYKDGTVISSKYWNSKGEEVDSLAEAEQ